MKELSIEEKAKRYDEAIELVNSKWHYKNQPCVIDVSEIFPELKESEDEKIRKELIEKIKTLADEEFVNYQSDFYAGDYNSEQILAWLEKQCEPKPVGKMQVSEELYEHIRNTCACIDDALSSETLADINDYLSMAERSANSAFDMIEKQVKKKASYTTIVETGDGGINALITKELHTEIKPAEENKGNIGGISTNSESGGAM